MIQKVMFHIHSLGKGGAERVVVTLSEEMVRRGLEVIIATAATEEIEYELPDKVRRIGIGTSAEEESRLPAAKLRRLRQERLRKALLAERPEVVYALCRGANYRAVRAAKGTGVPVIVSVRNDPKVDYGSLVHRYYSRYLYAKAAGAIFQTTGARDFFPEQITRRAAVIFNPIHPQFIGHSQPEGRRRAVVAVGRFHAQKDYMTLVKAFERIAKKDGELVLEIYGGKGEDNHYYQVLEWVRSHHLTKRILFCGVRSDLPEQIADAAAYVLSSRYEGMPNALMEAMALGLPVVATDCPSGGVASLIEDGANGLLAEVGNDRELAVGIGKLLDYPQEAERLGREARRIAERASVQRITEEWLAYAERVIG